MELVLTSDRLRLTPLLADDIDLAIEMFTDPQVVKYLGGPMSVAEIHAEMPTWLRRGGDGCIGIWCVSDIGTGEKYGSTALLPMPVEEDDTDWSLVVPGEMPAGDIEVGYFLKRAAWGKGIATEVCRRMLEFAFEETVLQEVVATVDSGNSGSRRVLDKCGFTHFGPMRAYGEDNPGYRITREQWQKRQQQS